MVAVRDVVRDVVAEVAPQELPLVDGLASYDDETVVRRLNRAGPRREPLGFGWGEVIGLVTPVVWLVLNEVAQRLAGTVVDGTTKRAQGLLRRLGRRNRAPMTIRTLTTDELAELREELLDLFIKRGLAAEVAAQLVAAVLRRLRPGSDESHGEPNSGG